MELSSFTGDGARSLEPFRWHLKEDVAQTANDGNACTVMGCALSQVWEEVPQTCGICGGAGDGPCPLSRSMPLSDESLALGFAGLATTSASMPSSSSYQSTVQESLEAPLIRCRGSIPFLRFRPVFLHCSKAVQFFNFFPSGPCRLHPLRRLLANEAGIGQA